MAEAGKKKPMYQVIVDDLKRKIRDGDIHVDMPFPSQIELAREYATSEITSRRALTELVAEGFIYRTRGKGTFLRVDGEGVPFMRSADLRTIYFVHRVPSMLAFNHRFFTGMFEGINQVCEEHEIEFKLLQLESDLHLPEGDDIGFILHGFTGVETIPLEVLRKWKEEGKRLLSVHLYYPHLQIPYVIVDNLTGGYLATEHLLALGHRRIGVILTGRSHMELNQEFSLRLQGYQLALSQHRIDFDPALVNVQPNNSETWQAGFDGFQQLMSLPEPPTAIFTGTDIKAFGVMKAAAQKGIRIPEDVSIVGYDDMQVDPFTTPALTSVNQNSFKLGKRAAEMLLFEWKGDSMKEEIVPSLMVRDSTKELDTSY